MHTDAMHRQHGACAGRWRRPGLSSLPVLAALAVGFLLLVSACAAPRSIPLAASWFALPFTISNSRLAALFVRFTPAWQAARRLAVPRVAGLALPWLLTAQDERHAIAPATTLAAHIQTVYTADAQAMQRFSQQSRHIDAQVTTLDAGCPPMPA